MKKRSALDIQLTILKTIKDSPNITMSLLERKIGTNPRSLKEHCLHLEFFDLVKIVKEERTTKLSLLRNAEAILKNTQPKKQNSKTKIRN